MLPFPPDNMLWLIDASITNACNFSCHYCKAKAKHTHVNKYLHAAEARQCIDIYALMAFICQMEEASPCGVHVMLTGGEPLAHPAFNALIAALHIIKEKGMRVKISVLTNMSLLNPLNIHSLNLVDAVVAGYHPHSWVPCKLDEHSESWKSEDGLNANCDLQWVKTQLDKLETPVKIVNYICGAYEGVSNWKTKVYPVGKGEEMAKETQEKALAFAAHHKLHMVFTPMDRRIGIPGCDLQLAAAPPMVAIRPDGTILQCNGEESAVGNINEDAFAKEKHLCEKQCALCPSFYPFIKNEHLFMGNPKPEAKCQSPS